jgi:hypothetical protein
VVAKTPDSGTVSASERRRATLRFALGTAQIFGAAVAIVLLFLTGVNPWSLTAVTLTCVFTTVSVLLFGDRTRHGRGDRE